MSNMPSIKNSANGSNTVYVTDGGTNMRYVNNTIGMKKMPSRNPHITPSALTIYALKSNGDMNTLYVNDWVEEQYALILNFVLKYFYKKNLSSF